MQTLFTLLRENAYLDTVKRLQLPHLVRLLDDESPVVRAEVLTAMEGIGPSLDKELESLGIHLSRNESAPIQHLLDKGRRKEFRSAWRGWFTMNGDKQRLESALQTIVALQDGSTAALELPDLLDEFADTYRQRTPVPDALGLSQFLFRKDGLRGAEQTDYLNPLNSNLVYVIREKRGLPISLACVFLLVGHRLGLAIEGCNFPGHFLVIAPLESKRVLVDCYNQGRMIDESDLSSIDARVSMKDLLRLECRADDIVARVLRNLVNAYNQTGNPANARLMTEALSMMASEVSPSTRQNL